MVNVQFSYEKTIIKWEISSLEHMLGYDVVDDYARNVQDNYNIMMTIIIISNRIITHHGRFRTTTGGLNWVSLSLPKDSTV